MVVKPPKEVIGAATEVACKGDEGCVISRYADAVAPEASVTMKVWGPAAVAKFPVPVKGPVPPVALTITFTVPPKQLTAPADAVAESGNVVATPFLIKTFDVYGCKVIDPL